MRTPSPNPTTDARHSQPPAQPTVRLVTAVGKYWICKRTPQHAYEAMKCIGGSAVMEDSPFPRLYREAPINAIWEGSGNVQCLDVLRAMQKNTNVVDAFFSELHKAQGANAMLDRSVAALKDGFCASRLGGTDGWQFGTLPAGVDCAGIVTRATPQS